jgi:DNA invertase Pin-like site-specific DNA recombinase
MPGTLKTKPKVKPAATLAGGETAGPVAYSYLRFSNPEQSKGDSVRRQTGLAASWSERKKVPLDTTLTLRDEGVSAFRGRHRSDKHDLGKFLAEVEKGRVRPGDYFLIENLDRLSREEEVPATHLLLGMLVKGVKVVQLFPQELELTDKSDAFTIMRAVMELARGHSESAVKSRRVKEARAENRRRAREEKRVWTRRCPAWLRVVDGNFEVIPEAGKTVAGIFDWRLQGVSLEAIERRLNEEAPWRPPVLNGEKGKYKGGTWRQSYVRKILKNRACIGEYQPHEGTGSRAVPSGPPIQGYYPRVVSDDTFNAVQRQFEANRVRVSPDRVNWKVTREDGDGNEVVVRTGRTEFTGRGGRIGKAKNLLTGLAACPYCSGVMAFTDKRDGKKDRRRLVCDNGRRRVSCSRHTMKYAECEELILSNCPDLRPEQVLPDPDEQAARCQALGLKVKGKEAELADIDRRLGNLGDQVGDEDDRAVRDLLRGKIRDLNARREVVLGEKVEAEKELRDAEQATGSFTAWQKNLAAMRTALEGGDVELRLKVRSHLRELIEKIEVFASGTAYDPDNIYDGLTAYLEDPFDAPDDLSDFCEDLAKRLNSPEGRFVRVHFKTGFSVDLVPDGSLALGEKLDKTRHVPWRTVQADVGRLYREWRASRVGG